MDSNNVSLAIQTRGLTKQYGQAVVVNELDLSIEAGQFYGLLGPNGAGKSTTIHMLTTMTSPTHGEAWIDGQSVRDDPVAIRGSVGLVFQDSALDRTMSIDENLKFSAALYNLTKQQTTDRIDELLAIFGLEKHRHKKLVALSGGQRRAVDIARGVLHRPKVLFLDEPTIGLDLPNRRAIWRFVEQLRKQEGMTVFLTTHYLEEAEACDRVDFIQQGILQTGGAPADLIQQQGEYILEVQATDKDRVLELLTPLFGQAVIEDQHLSFQIKQEDVDFSLLQQSIDKYSAAMQWRRPNLNDVYLWTIHRPQEAE